MQHIKISHLKPLRNKNTRPPQNEEKQMTHISIGFNIKFILLPILMYFSALHLFLKIFSMPYFPISKGLRIKCNIIPSDSSVLNPRQNNVWIIIVQSISGNVIALKSD